MRRCELGIPLVDCILISHAQVTSRANRNKVLYRHIAALALWGIVTALIVKHVHPIRTPNNFTLCIKLTANLQQPHLFA